MFADSRLKEFLQAVAAKTPTPGGGSVSAAVGALGAALGVMTARFSDAGEPEHVLDGLKDELLKLIDVDAEAYGQVNSALALPKATDEEKKRRKQALQNALAEAAEVPLKAMLLAARALGALSELAPRCNKHLASDLAGATYFLEAALLGCGENVRINAAALVDKERAGRLTQEHGRLVAQAAELRSHILKEVGKLYGGK